MIDEHGAQSLTVRHTPVGGQIYWAVADIVALLHTSGDEWIAHADVDNVPQAVGGYLHQIATDLDAEGMQQLDWWASARPGVVLAPATALIDSLARVEAADVSR